MSNTSLGVVVTLSFLRSYLFLRKRERPGQEQGEREKETSP